MPNLYKSAKMKKYLDDEPDEAVERTQMKEKTRSLICGLSGTGKTNALMQYIVACSGIYDKIYLCFKTDEPFYECLVDELKKDDLIAVYKSVESFPEVDEFADASEYKRQKEKPPKYLIIFDDCLNDCKIGKNNLKMRKYFTYGRKKCLTIFFLSQSYYQTEKFYRDQMNYILLTSIASSKDLGRITKEYSLGSLTDEVITSAYKMVKENDKDNELDFLKIDLHGNTPANRKLSKNFDQFIEYE